MGAGMATPWLDVGESMPDAYAKQMMICAASPSFAVTGVAMEALMEAQATRPVKDAGLVAGADQQARCVARQLVAIKVDVVER